MAYQGYTGSSRAIGAVSRGNTQNTQVTQLASNLLVTAQQGLNKEKEEDRVFLEILGLFTNYIIPSKRDKFAITLLGILNQLDL